MANQNGRVTQKQLYETMTGMEQRIVRKLEKNTDAVNELSLQVAKFITKVEEHDKDISFLRTRDWIAGTVSIIGAAFIAAFRK